MEKEILFIKITVSLVLESRVLKLIYDGVERKDDELGCYMATESSLGLLGDIDLLILGISSRVDLGYSKIWNLSRALVLRLSLATYP